MVSSTLSRVAGIAAFTLMIARLGRLLETGTDAPAWHLILIASAFLGGVVWWFVGQTVTSLRVRIGVLSAAGLLLFLRIAVPQSLVFGLIPGPETPLALISELSESFDIFRFGVSPVFPSAGLVATLAVVVWAIGALFVWGAAGGPVAAMSVPSLAMYLQFGVMDRVPAGRGWMGVAVAAFTLSVAAIANEQRSSAGRVRDADGRPIARRGGSMAFGIAAVIAIASLALTSAAAEFTNEQGAVNFRTGGGYGDGFGGISFNRLVGLQKRVISRSNAELFIATLDESAPPTSQIYWRMETLDTYDGQSWLPTPERPERYTPANAGGDSAHDYQGTTTTFTQRVKIEALRGPLVPTAGIAEALQSDTEDINQFQVARDGSLVIQSQLDEGMTYQAEAVYPLEQEDINALATGPDGQLTTLFAGAGDAGAYDLSPRVVDTDIPRPNDIGRFLDLPDDLPGQIATIGRERTAGAQSDFERATLLQHWFRDSGDFTYSTAIDAGHTDLKLVDWLADPESVDYRTGYCEQFAASMAVIGRALDIPSRVVWGFTPGDEVTQSDGSKAVVVRDNNAHAWVEMWMDGFGWVRFDPTPRGDGALPASFTESFDPRLYVGEPLQQPQTSDQPGFGEDGPQFGIDDADLGAGGEGDSTGLPTWLWLIPVAFAAILVVPLLKRLRRNGRLRSIRNGDVTAAWDEIVDQLRDLGESVPAHQTPIEFARATDRSLMPLAHAYGASIYGGQANKGEEGDFVAVENWIRLKYEGGERMRARFRPTSLLARRNGDSGS